MGRFVLAAGLEADLVLLRRAERQQKLLAARIELHDARKIPALDLVLDVVSGRSQRGALLVPVDADLEAAEWAEYVEAGLDRRGPVRDRLGGARGRLHEIGQRRPQLRIEVREQGECEELAALVRAVDVAIEDLQILQLGRGLRFPRLPGILGLGQLEL